MQVGSHGQGHPVPPRAPLSVSLISGQRRKSLTSFAAPPRALLPRGPSAAWTPTPRPGRRPGPAPRAPAHLPAQVSGAGCPPGTPRRQPRRPARDWDPAARGTCRRRAGRGGDGVGAGRGRGERRPLPAGPGRRRSLPGPQRAARASSPAPEPAPGAPFPAGPPRGARASSEAERLSRLPARLGPPPGRMRGAGDRGRPRCARPRSPKCGPYSSLAPAPATGWRLRLNFALLQRGAGCQAEP